MDNAPAQLPASWLDAGYGIPTCCARHGNPATTARKVQFISRPPVWAYLLLIAGVLPFLIVSLVMRKTATPQAWPFCPQCQSQRAKGLGIGLGLLVLSVVLFVVPFVVAGDSAELGPIGLLFPLSLFVFFAGLLFAALNGWVATAGGIVTGDGVWVQFAKAHPNFAEQASAALASANQQAAVPGAR
jgi:hypothetical protein